MTSLSVSPTSAAQAVIDTRNLLSASLRDELVRVASDYSPGDSTITVASTSPRLGQGAVLSAGPVTFYVTSVAGGTCEVIAGYEGNQDVAVPAGTIMRVSPRFTDNFLFTTVKHVIGSLSSASNGLYGVVTWSAMSSDGVFPIPEQIAPYLLSVSTVTVNTEEDIWLPVYGWQAVTVPGNMAVTVFEPYDLTYRFTATTKIVPPASFTADLITDCGMSDTMLDLPSLGAASILMHGQEARRAHQEAQGDPRRSELVPITGATSAGREFRRMFRERVNEEAQRLIAVRGVTRQILP